MRDPVARRTDGGRKCDRIARDPSKRDPAVGNVAARNSRLPAASIFSQTGVAILSFRTEECDGRDRAGGETCVLMIKRRMSRKARRVQLASRRSLAGPAVPARRRARPLCGAARRHEGHGLHADARQRRAAVRARNSRPACRDNGFVIFDPQSWRLSAAS